MQGKQVKEKWRREENLKRNYVGRAFSKEYARRNTLSEIMQGEKHKEKIYVGRTCLKTMSGEKA